MDFKLVVVLLFLALVAFTQATPCNGTSTNVSADRLKRSGKSKTAETRIEEDNKNEKETTPTSHRKKSEDSKKSKKKKSS